MGFGTLFFGYFLLLNLTYFGYTDLIAALIMLMGLYKLCSVNAKFKVAAISSAVFGAFGAAELFVNLFSTFSPAFKEEKILLYITPVRYLLIAMISAYILFGITEVAAEVGLKPLHFKAKLYSKVSLVAFLVAAIFDLPLLSFIPGKALVIISVFILLFLFCIEIVNLTIIHKAYAKICMPEDLSYTEAKPSRFGFVNKFREHEQEKQKEYAEYKISKMKKQNAKRKKKK